jgi:hypothetical protein
VSSSNNSDDKHYVGYARHEKLYNIGKVKQRNRCAEKVNNISTELPTSGRELNLDLINNLYTDFKKRQAKSTERRNLLEREQGITFRPHMFSNRDKFKINSTFEERNQYAIEKQKELKQLAIELQCGSGGGHPPDKCGYTSSSATFRNRTNNNNECNKDILDKNASIKISNQHQEENKNQIENILSSNQKQNTASSQKEINTGDIQTFTFNPQSNKSKESVKLISSGKKVMNLNNLNNLNNVKDIPNQLNPTQIKTSKEFQTSFQKKASNNNNNNDKNKISFKSSSMKHLLENKYV